MLGLPNHLHLSSLPKAHIMIISGQDKAEKQLLSGDSILDSALAKPRG